MKVRITLGKLPWQYDTGSQRRFLKQSHARLNRLFAPYAPKLLTGAVAGRLGFPTHELSVPADDAAFEKLVKQFSDEIKQAKPAVGGCFDAVPGSEETKRARFLEPLFFGDCVDEDANSNEPLNQPRRILCDACKFPDISQVPVPLLVSKAVLRKQDVFRVTTGMLVVRTRVLRIFQEAIGEQMMEKSG